MTEGLYAIDCAKIMPVTRTAEGWLTDRETVLPVGTVVFSTFASAQIALLERVCAAQLLIVQKEIGLLAGTLQELSALKAQEGVR